jgi:hypothetical protein
MSELCFVVSNIPELDGEYLIHKDRIIFVTEGSYEHSVILLSNEYYPVTPGLAYFYLTNYMLSAVLSGKLLDIALVKSLGSEKRALLYKESIKNGSIISMFNEQIVESMVASGDIKATADSIYEHMKTQTPPPIRLVCVIMEQLDIYSSKYRLIEFLFSIGCIDMVIGYINQDHLLFQFYKKLIRLSTDDIQERKY